MSEYSEPLKPGDVLLSVPSGHSGVIQFGFDNQTFLRFCANHAKPFGFRWDFKSRSCPKCGPEFVEDPTRNFVMIKNGFTITRSFRHGVEIAPQVLAEHWPGRMWFTNEWFPET